MEFTVEVLLVILSGESVIIRDNELPTENVTENNIKETASKFFKEITGIEPIVEYSGWIFLENTGWYDGILRQKNGKKVISFVFSAIMPENIKLKGEYEWKKITMELLNQLKFDHSKILKSNLK